MNHPRMPARVLDHGINDLCHTRLISLHSLDFDYCQFSCTSTMNKIGNSLPNMILVPILLLGFLRTEVGALIRGLIRGLISTYVILDSQLCLE